jgi:hypothetical protein
MVSGIAEDPRTERDQTPPANSTNAAGRWIAIRSAAGAHTNVNLMWLTTAAWLSEKPTIQGVSSTTSIVALAARPNSAGMSRSEVIF